jgi:hypothetical protein
VASLVAAAKGAVDRFKAFFEDTYDLRKRVQHELARHTRKDNICFDGHARVATSPTPPTGASNTPSWCSTRTPRTRWRRS